MLKLYKLENTLEHLIEIKIVNGDAPAPYAESMGFVPNGTGFTLYVKDLGFRFYQVAAKNIASFGLFNVKVVTDTKISKEDALYFTQGLFDNKHDLEIAFDLNDDDLAFVLHHAKALFKYRQIANTSACDMPPVKFVNTLFETLKESITNEQGSLSLECIDRDSKEFSKFTGLNAVGHGSVNSPCMGIIDYIPKNLNKDSKIDICLVGKGITFDSGGYDLKPSNYMLTMRTDKSGATYVVAAAHLAILNNLDKRLRIYLPCSENLVSGNSMLPGDILKYKDDLTVEIGNTDAEGRLVLADALMLASKDKPSYILDAATLTGAAKIAIGRDMTLVSTTKESLALYDLLDCADANEEMFIYIPTYEYVGRYLKSSRATINNISKAQGTAGALTATAFLSNFVDKDIPWIHVDLSSAYAQDATPWFMVGSTCAGVMSIAALLNIKDE